MESSIRSRWTVTLGGFLLGSVVSLGLVVGVGFAILAYGNRPANDPSHQSLYLRSDFTEMIMGKTEEEVLDAVGKPDRTSEDGDTRYWHYRKRTKDPVTGTPDSDVQVVFNNGKVVTVD
jgi:outer membrane protein assembly factor BamE (lipoprotein component of BamABCDE complex)